MLRSTTRAVFTCGAALLVTSCSDATEPPEDAANTASMEATIDGTLWQAANTFCDYDTLDRMLWVGGSRETSIDTVRHIELQALTITGPGTVSLTLNGPRALIHDGVGWSTVRSYGTTDTLTGTATVTHFDLAARRCSGTFCFAAVTNFGPFPIDTVHVTNGSWTAELHIS